MDRRGKAPAIGLEMSRDEILATDRRRMETEIDEIRRKSKEAHIQLIENHHIFFGTGPPLDRRKAQLWPHMIEEQRSKAKEYIKELELDLKPPPLYSDEVGELDLSEAVLLNLDGQAIKHCDYNRFSSLLEFWYDCRRKAALQLFTHPGCYDVGGVRSMEGASLQLCDSYHDLVHTVIATVNTLRNDIKLKLIMLRKVNTMFTGNWRHYMTLDAIDEFSGQCSTYQAAIFRRTGCPDQLGLFRDSTKDRTLAIMYLHGSEDDLVARARRIGSVI